MGVCGGRAYWSKRAQRGSCVLHGKQWGWSRAAVVAAVVCVWCGDDDIHSSSLKWRWLPTPTKTLKSEEEQFSLVNTCEYNVTFLILSKTT